MPIDPCYAELIGNPRNTLRSPPPGFPIADLRAGTEAALAGTERPPVHEVRDLSVPGDHAIPLRLYRPSAEPGLSVVLFVHGGGFVLCSLETHDAMCRAIALASGAAVVAVDYRLAPETRFPGGLEDCYAALAWVAANPDELGVDANRIAVVGDSAGGNLAAAISLMAREHGPMLRHLGLIYPMIDPRCDSASMHSLPDGPVVTPEALRWFWDCYLGDGDRAHPLAALLNADLAGLPPVSLLTAEYDPLRDEGEVFAARLRAAGVPLVARRYVGMAHGFLSMPAMTQAAARAAADLGGDLGVGLAGRQLI